MRNTLKRKILISYPNGSRVLYKIYQNGNIHKEDAYLYPLSFKWLVEHVFCRVDVEYYYNEIGIDIELIK